MHDHYYYQEEHRLFRRSLRDLLDREVLLHLNAREAAGEMPRWVWRRFGEMGYFGLNFPGRYDTGDYLMKECAMAKLLCTELAGCVTSEALQSRGDYGYLEEYRAARQFRDSRLGTIGGGTSEIICELIARMVIDEKVYEGASVQGSGVGWMDGMDGWMGWMDGMDG